MTKMRAGAADMARVMELIRAGRPAEATALLQGGGSAATPLGDMAFAMPGFASAPGPGRSAPVPGMRRGRVETAAGGRDYALFVPDRPRHERALVVMLHGCTQDADDFARGTRMNDRAGAAGLHVLWPEQAREANPTGCWNWFDPAHQTRGTGEPAVLAEMIARVSASEGIAPGRVFVAGLSAGGAMAAVLAAEHPEMFAGAGVHSGLPAGAARSMPEALAAMNSGPPAAAATAGRPGGVPLFVIHGDADRTVSPRNGAALAADVGRGPRYRGTSGGRAWTRIVGPGGEAWAVQGLGHAWSGGAAAGSHTDAAGPDASAEMVRFFLDRMDQGRVIDQAAAE